MGFGAMIVAAGVIGRKIGIRPKKHDDWLVIPNLWAVLIGGVAAVLLWSGNYRIVERTMVVLVLLLAGGFLLVAAPGLDPGEGACHRVYDLRDNDSCDREPGPEGWIDLGSHCIQNGGS